MTPERQAIVDRLNSAIAERNIADEHAENLQRAVDKIDEELVAYDQAVFRASRKGAA